MSGVMSCQKGMEVHSAAGQVAPPPCSLTATTGFTRLHAGEAMADQQDARRVSSSGNYELATANSLSESCLLPNRCLITC